ncbi:MAG: response regulator [Mycolicibacterium sp.]|uniref:hypothetical protein n=1 Tax=Mycolicibacterium sp. TaxID=2320850 RepID=UPI000FACDD6D|nr:hypothetical protein [Mycolicibacterium sp.]RUP28031.1 MAG: response regulator [Mycolicibacterium sp.]
MNVVTNNRASLRVLVYSSNAQTRWQIIGSLGPQPRADLPNIDYLEAATGPTVIGLVDAGNVDLAILDGEATPAGGIGVAKRLRDEVALCPPILVLTGRPDDAWLANWSQADAVVSHPIDPIQFAQKALTLLRTRCETAGYPSAAASR